MTAVAHAILLLSISTFGLISVDGSCSTATPITVPGLFPFSIVNRTDDSGLSSCASSIGDVYFVTQPLSSVLVRVSTCDTHGGSAAMPTMLAAYSSCSGAPLACNTFACGTVQSLIEFVASDVPTQYRLRVAGHEAPFTSVSPLGDGTFVVTVTACGTCESMNATSQVFDSVCDRVVDCGPAMTSSTTGGFLQQEFGRWGFQGPSTDSSIAGMAAIWRDIDRSFYIFGGQVLRGSAVIFSNEVAAYSALRNSWSTVPCTGEVPRGRYYTGQTMLGDAWYIYGGLYPDSDSGVTVSARDFYRLDLMTRTWQQLPSGVTDRGASSLAASNDGKLVLFGGQSLEQSNLKLNTIEIFDTTTMTWLNGSALQIRGNPPVPRYLHSAVVTRDNRMIVYGGAAFLRYSPSGTQILQALNDVAIFDINTTTWLTPPTVTGVSPARIGHKAVYLQTYNSMLVFLGVRYVGNTTGLTFRNELYRLHLDTWQWSNMTDNGPAVPRGRNAHQVVRISDTAAMMYGGVNATALLNDLWVYDVTTATPGGTVPTPFVPGSPAVGAVSVDMQIVLDANFSEFNYTNFAAAVSALVGLPSNLLVVTSYVRGSVVVQFTIFSGDGFDSQAVASELVQKLTEDPGALGSIGAVTSVTEVSGRPDARAESPARNDVPLIVGLTVGLGCFVLIALAALIAALVVRRRKRAARRRQPPVVLSDLSVAPRDAQLSDEDQLLLPQLPFPPSSVIDWDDVGIERQLGAGAFGTVFKARYRGNWCVVKLCAQTTLERQTKFLKEAFAMTRLRPSPNIVQLLGVCIDPTKTLAIVLEWVEGGSLDQLLYDRTKPVTAELAIAILRDVAAGCRNLHADNILHCDLSARNVLIVPRPDGMCTAKIADFGLSHFLDLGQGNYSSDTALQLPIRWAAPEVLENPSETSKAGDVWSFGVLMWEILQREVPYRNLLENAQVIVAVTKGQRLPPPTAFEHPPELDELLQQCFRTVPAERPSIADVHEKLEKLLAQMQLQESPYELTPTPAFGIVSSPYGTVNTSAYTEDSSVHYLADGWLTSTSVTPKAANSAPSPPPELRSLTERDVDAPDCVKEAPGSVDGTLAELADRQPSRTNGLVVKPDGLTSDDPVDATHVVT